MMQKRWLRLAFSTVFSLVAVFWIAASYDGFELLRSLAVQIGGLMAATVIALVGLYARVPRRWPAAIVLVAAAPMAQLVLRVEVIRVAFRLDAPSTLLVLGLASTVIAALAILFVKLPAADDPLARAVARQRSSE